MFLINHLFLVPCFHPQIEAVYSRDANIDEHLESSISTFPSEFESEQRRYKEKNVQNFMAEVTDPSAICSKIPNIEHVRQITTLLHHHSSYLNYRSHLLKDRISYPATILTLSKYPTKGFSMSTNNQNRLL
ncbi:hypothetical protein BDF21DRAFT_393680 [Thamnidium elegans]|nr:hypothetical protein BDF21DRAFT_393680 [Thamnidium elegans]